MKMERYEQILDNLENDKNALKKLSKKERNEISSDPYAMKIAAATNVENLKFLSEKWRKNPKYIHNVSKTVNPLAFVYGDKNLMSDEKYVAAIKKIASDDAKIYGDKMLESLYKELINKQMQKAISNNVQK